MLRIIKYNGTLKNNRRKNKAMRLKIFKHSIELMHDDLVYAYKYYKKDGVNYKIEYRYKYGTCFVPNTYPAGEPHYDADIYVWEKLNDNTMILINDIPIEGTYVPQGCWEDVPSIWVKKALNL